MNISAAGVSSLELAREWDMMGGRRENRAIFEIILKMAGCMSVTRDSKQLARSDL